MRQKSSTSLIPRPLALLAAVAIFLLIAYLPVIVDVEAAADVLLYQEYAEGALSTPMSLPATTLALNSSRTAGQRGHAVKCRRVGDVRSGNRFRETSPSWPAAQHWQGREA